MSSIDTNLVLRLLLQDHAVQSPAITNMMSNGRSGEFAVADAVIFECVWILQGAGYGFDRRLVADLVIQLVDIDAIDCDRTLLARVLPLYVHYPSVSFIDVALAVCAEQDNALPLLSYDKKLAKALPDLVELVA